MMVPRWYQELSIPQMNRIRALNTAIQCDFDENLTIRTRKILADVGITSEFVKFSSNCLKKIFEKSKTDPGRFLCEIYRAVTGKYFEEERGKKVYDCNERLILTAIAFLYLPETIVELHRKLPIPTVKKNNPSSKKKPFPRVFLQQKFVKSPYLQSHVEEYNLILHRSNERSKTQKIGKFINSAKPRVILPPPHLILKSNQAKQSNKRNNFQRNHEKTRSFSQKKIPEKNSVCLKTSHAEDFENLDLNEPKKNVQLSLEIDENFSDNEEDKLSVQNENFSDTGDKKFSKEFKDLENKSPDVFVSEEDDVSSDCSEDCLNNQINYPNGREYISRLWPKSLRNIEEEYALLSSKADDILNDVYKTTRKIFNANFCSQDCLEKTENHQEKRETQDLLIESLVLDGKLGRKVIGSLTLNSPPQSLPASKTNLSKEQEITLSEDKLIKKNIISGLVIADGKTINQIGGIAKDRVHFSYKIPSLSKRKNILPCNCSCAENHKCRNKMDSSLENFLLAREAKENLKKQVKKRIDHTTCIQRFKIDKKEVEDKKPEACKKCINFPDKCRKNLFEEMKEFSCGEKKKEGGVEVCKENIKFSISGMKQISDDDAKNCRAIISNVVLLSLTSITPALSEERDDTLSSLSQHNNFSEPKVNSVENSGEEKLIKKRNKRISKTISSKSNKIKEEIINLYKQVEELDDIKNKFRRSLETKIDVSVNDSKHVMKKQSRKQIDAGKKSIKISKKNIALKETVDVDAEVKNEIVVEKAAEDEEKISNFEENSVNEIKNNKDLLGRNDDLITLMKIALKEMANENFLLAKLPDCDKLPQLRLWIKYRKGFVDSLLEEDELRDKIENINEQSGDSSKIAAPQIDLEKYQETLKYSDVKKLENLVKLKKKLFYGKVRKSRVNRSRSAWNQLQFDNNLPDLLFKSAYFIYQPAKEADGFLVKPYVIQSSVEKNRKSNS